MDGTPRRSKHSPNRLDNYQSVHETRMEQFLRSRFVVRNDLEWDYAEGAIQLIGRITCRGNIYIDVEKTLLVLGGEGVDALVQTVFYSYNVSLAGVGNIFRYDSPGKMGAVESMSHHRHHHKHTYDVFEGDVRGRIDLIDDEELVPTLREVIEEAEKWYWEHVQRLPE